MIDHKDLKSLIKMMVDNDLTELELQDASGEKVALKRGHGAAAPVQYMAAPHPMPSASSVPSLHIPGAGSPESAASTAGLTPIASPMVGTFYASSSPEAKPFVAVGDRVTPDTVVCIIEAMKVFNEIKAETSGVIEQVLVTNGKAVEFGQALYMVKPG